MSTRAKVAWIALGWALVAGVVWYLLPTYRDWYLFVYMGVIVALGVLAGVLDWREKKLLAEDLPDPIEKDGEGTNGDDLTHSKN